MSKIVAIIDPPYGISLVKNGMVGADFGIAKKGEYAPVMGDGDIDVAPCRSAGSTSPGICLGCSTGRRGRPDLTCL